MQFSGVDVTTGHSGQDIVMKTENRKDKLQHRKQIIS